MFIHCKGNEDHYGSSLTCVHHPGSRIVTLVSEFAEHNQQEEFAEHNQQAEFAEHNQQVEVAEQSAKGIC